MLSEALSQLEFALGEYIFLKEDGSERIYPFRDFVECVRYWTAVLRRAGLSSREHVAIILSDHEQFVFTFLGAVGAGIVPVPLCPPGAIGGPQSYSALIALMMKKSEISAVITNSRTAPILKDALNQAHASSRVITFETLTRLTVVGGKWTPVSGGDVCFLQHTSGSTSEPKPVRVTHASLEANSKAIMNEGLSVASRRDKVLSWLPLYHDMGLVGHALAPLFVGLSVVFIPTRQFAGNVGLWMGAAARYRATISFAPNFAFRLVNARVKREQLGHLDLTSLRVVGCGSEAIDADTLRRFAKLYERAGLHSDAILPCYGLAETTLAATFHARSTPLKTKNVAVPEDETLAPNRRKEATNIELVGCGTPFEGHQVAVVSDSGEPVKEGSEGEIVLRGPSVAAGYFKDPEATARTFRADGLHTGDVGFFTEGSLFISGRKRDLIVIRGKKHHAEFIENAICQTPSIRVGRAAAFAARRAGTEELVLVVEVAGPRSNRDRARAVIVEQLFSQTGLEAGEVLVVNPGTLPTTSSGKVKRQLARQIYQSGLAT
jgi:fatty-acyl-CoA synthase